MYVQPDFGCKAYEEHPKALYGLDAIVNSEPVLLRGWKGLLPEWAETDTDADLNFERTDDG